jgi:hypothetical protein
LAFGTDDEGETPEHRIDLVVANYILNIRGGLIDATGLFYDLDEDDEDE